MKFETYTDDEGNRHKIIGYYNGDHNNHLGTDRMYTMIRDDDRKLIVLTEWRKASEDYDDWTINRWHEKTLLDVVHEAFMDY